MSHRERTVVGETNRPPQQLKQQQQQSPGGSRRAFDPAEPSSASPSRERMMATTQSAASASKAKTAEERAADGQRIAQEEVQFHHRAEHAKPRKPASSSSSAASAVQLAPDPSSPLYSPDSERFVTTKSRPNERLDAHEAEIRRQRDTARLESIRGHEAGIAATVKTLDQRTEQREEARAVGIQRQREQYGRAVDARRARDGRATGSHDVSVAEAFQPDAH